MATIVPYKGKWRAVIRRVGYPTRTKVLDTHKQAEEWARGVEVEMDTKVYVVPDRTKTKDVFEAFRDKVCPKRAGCRWEVVRINRFLRTISWMEKPLEDVDRFDLQDWRDRRLDEVSGSSVNRELNLISGVITHAMQEWGATLRVNPVHEIKRPDKGKARRRRVTGGEVAALDKVFEFDESVPPTKGYGAVKSSVMWVFHIAKETGLRTGEILALQWKDVHLDQAWLHVYKSKNGDERDVPLTERAEFLLRKIGEGDPDDLVFPLNPGSFGATYRKLRNSVGLDLHMHDTRHEAASNLAKVLSQMELSKALGHRDPRTTMIYYNPTPAELAQKVRGKVKST